MAVGGIFSWWVEAMFDEKYRSGATRLWEQVFLVRVKEGDAIPLARAAADEAFNAWLDRWGETEDKPPPAQPH